MALGSSLDVLMFWDLPVSLTCLVLSILFVKKRTSKSHTWLVKCSTVCDHRLAAFDGTVVVGHVRLKEGCVSTVLTHNLLTA